MQPVALRQSVRLAASGRACAAAAALTSPSRTQADAEATKGVSAAQREVLRAFKAMTLVKMIQPLLDEADIVSDKAELLMRESIIRSDCRGRQHPSGL